MEIMSFAMNNFVPEIFGGGAKFVTMNTCQKIPRMSILTAIWKRSLTNATRNKIFLNVFIFLLCRLLNSICGILYVCCGDLGHIPNNTSPLQGVLIKFEVHVGSWLEKSNQLYEQGAIRPLSLGGVLGHAPSENFEIWKLWNAISSILGNKSSHKHIWKLYSLYGHLTLNKCKKKSFFNCILRYWANDFTNKMWEVFLY